MLILLLKFEVNNLENRFIPYGRQSISEEDIQAVVEALRSDWLTQGPAVEKFENAVAEYCGARYGVAVANGTAALHLAALAAGFGLDDEVITSPITFVASANCIVYTGAKPVFADIMDQTCCIDPQQIETKITPATKGLIPVHFAGQPCDMKAIADLAYKYKLVVIEDAAHAIGSSYEIDGHVYRVGSCSHSNMTIFSFHPVKHITTGEGGFITTNSEKIYHKLLLLRSHGINKEPSELTKISGPWYYEQQILGFNYRITDFQCVLGFSQLKKIDVFIGRRKEIVAKYNEAFSKNEKIIIPFEAKNAHSSWHLYSIQFINIDRSAVFSALREKGLGVNVHYIPVHLQPYYVEHYGYGVGDYAKAETYYSRTITLPLYPAMRDDDVDYVVNSVFQAIEEVA